MKTIDSFFIATALLILSISSLQAQDTEGKEFWLTFGQSGNLPYALPINMQIRIVSGNSSTTGTIHFTNLGTSVTFSMGAYEIYTYALDNAQKQAVYNTTMGVTNYSIHITSIESVSVYAATMTSELNDVTNVLPVTALDKEYYAISWYVYVLSDAYAVIATQNNTLLRHNGTLVATLNAGEVYYRTSSTDMTGSHITANNPVAFFAQHQGASIPDGFINILFQQLAPVNTWGKTFLVPVTINNGTNYVRIVVSQNNTSIVQTGGTIRTDFGGQPTLTNLQAGQFVELEILLSNNGCFIYADKPVGVCSFMQSSGTFNPIGSCSQVWIPPIEQSIPKVLMVPFVHPIYVDHYAIVSTSTAAKDNTKVSIGGALPIPLSGGIWYNNAAAQMSFYNFPIPGLSSYTFSNPEKIIVLEYGVGGYGVISASYYYLAGSSMRDLDAAFYANDVHFQDLQDTTFCTKDVYFRAEIEGLHADAGSLKWYIDGVEYEPARDQLQWSKPFETGEYEIKMWVRYENDETTTIQSTLKMDVFWVKIKNIRY